MHDPHLIALRSLKLPLGPGQHCKQTGLEISVESDLSTRWAFVDLYIPIDTAVPLTSVCLQLAGGAPGGELQAIERRYTLLAASAVTVIGGGTTWVMPGSVSLSVVETSIASSDLQFLFHARLRDVMPFTLATAILTIQPPAGRDLAVSCTYGLHQECLRP